MTRQCTVPNQPTPITPTRSFSIGPLRPLSLDALLPKPETAFAHEPRPTLRR